MVQVVTGKVLQRRDQLKDDMSSILNGQPVALPNDVRDVLLNTGNILGCKELTKKVFQSLTEEVRFVQACGFFRRKNICLMTISCKWGSHSANDFFNVTAASYFYLHSRMST